MFSASRLRRLAAAMEAHLHLHLALLRRHRRQPSGELSRLRLVASQRDAAITIRILTAIAMAAVAIK